MSYIKISNQASDVNRLFLEKLGLSTKRDDENTIGQFGSGSKFAPIAALRNGWEWINVGTDNLGPYQMEYVVENENGINSIFYKYTVDGEVTLKPSSFTLEAGILSWDHEFQIFREAFANALDEFISNGVSYSIDIVDNVEWEPNTFSVYITADPVLMAIIDDFDKWFDLNREPYITSASGAVYMPLSNEINIYHKGVYVYGDLVSKHEGDLIPLYDYRLNHVQLNEERRLRDTYYASSQIVNIWIEIFGGDFEDQRNVEFCERIIRNANGERWEFTNISSYAFNYVSLNSNNPLRTAWNNLYGETAVMLVVQQERFIHTVESVYSRKCIVIQNPMVFQLLTEAGVPTLDDVMGDEVDFDFVKFETGPKAEMFSTAMKIVSNYDERINTVDEIKIFAPNNDQQGILGVARNGSIYLSTSTFNSMESLIGTIIHELDHVVSGYQDEDRAFRDLADHRIAELVLKMYKDEPLNDNRCD
jgi:hypothetical protein